MVAQTSNCRLAGFGIRRAARAGVADGLYANGRHQYEVIIDAVKEVIDAKGEWAPVQLTDEERASVTVVECSKSHTPVLTRGWHCDEQRNEFMLGLWRGKSIAHESSIELQKSVGESLGDSIKRYLRCDPDAPIGPAVFMACVTIDGEVHTTYDFEKAAGVDLSITLNPVRPIELGANELDLYVDVSAFAARAPYLTRVDVYYFTPPDGLSVLRNLGFDEPLGLPGEGEDFRSVLTWHSPLDPSKTNRVGTFINKDQLGASLYLNEVHKRLPESPQNPLVRFNERPTIMRAIRLISGLVAENRDTRSVWRLLDNYGGEQVFSVVMIGNPIGLPEVPFFRLEDEAARKLKLIHFKIVLPDGGTVTDALYANGRHQCKVVVEIVVERVMPDGTSVPVRLSDAERGSVTITSYSRNVNEPLPPSWSCDQEKNIYDTGRWATGVDKAESGQCTQADARSSQRQIEMVERYLRVNPNVPIEERRFMASIKINGMTYTTNYADADYEFNSFVAIRASRPYQLKVQDLTVYPDHHAFSDSRCDIDVYYWTPPAGLRFLVNKGFDTPLSPANEGRNFCTSYNKRNAQQSFYKGGVVMNKDVVSPLVLIADIFTLHPEGHQRVVRFNQRPTIMRAVRFTGYYNSTMDSDSHSKWRLWDNYGCEHVFGLQQAGGGNLIELING
ncbi:hypothetical protein SO486_02330 [Pseudomonas salmasensis]|uniref:Uncharacterized protein n=1 Tax=Pseudomonas salmasensis TaxID=2745514 RepID=A0ABU5FC40_9PSED|nr:hypothetical protein [Pseudomonas salmasensis]MDY4298828.1 hypothetical protein [Pseudomonas salmasensis]